jgi:hypothetical protein
VGVEAKPVALDEGAVGHFAGVGWPGSGGAPHYYLPPKENIFPPYSFILACLFIFDRSTCSKRSKESLFSGKISSCHLCALHVIFDT